MTDPNRGGQPNSEGASTGKRKGGSPRRRGKGKKTGPLRNGHDASASAGSAATPVAERRSESVFADGPIRKRKRRRRGKGGAAPSEQPGGNRNAAASPVTHDIHAAVAAPKGPLTASDRPGMQAGNAVGHRQSSQNGQNSSENLSDPAAHRAGRKRKRNRSRHAVAQKPGHVRPLAGSQPPSVTAAKVRGPEPQSAPVTSSRLPQQHGGIQTAGRLRLAADGVADDLYAALDLGTNNCRLLIAQPTRPGQFRVVDAFSRIVRLGEGLAATGRLSQDAMDRAVEALRICASKLGARDIRRMRLIATEACRAAENGEVFLERVTVETGLSLEIINRETEARLAVSGCSSLVGREARSVVLFDIGGGSSEIAVIKIGDNRSSRLANHITHWTSLPVGVVTLSERHGGRDVTPDIFEAMTREVEGMLERFDCPELPAGPDGFPEDFHLIGTSGTVTTLAGVHLDLPRYDRRKVDGLWLSDAEVTAMQAKLLSWDYAGRAGNPCIGPDRADLVLAGCAILEAIRRRWPASRMRVADRGLREGLLTDMMADDGVWRRGRSRRPQTVKER
ncbi:exopolyphosphatase/guanosine-5'-triphosphate,3'-diphosphate pyrophosphatase [Peteryoungia aggregata LMG 23059]|uniref:Exopolyphosphatase/guanosine-5'-triphosphate, 3'-diphosphate pyrophosphatase n=1 Tax=Peteryoungia aggregata LMG 23059 TaxID=1368425 RepID=A0ABU0G3T7_9HYPH|nr:Ppx/GppA phosphatase family protein [Peteryoungia aggregata]MDQ0419634.1 exopolyphosphatase/guanosine-5'-triphosphate,3'-diphosphate pyrophosphatase [Peteryoungia aggregata LMG 23059]